MGGNAGESNRNAVTTTTQTITKETNSNNIGVTGQDAVDLAGVLGQSAANADTLVQNLNTTNEAANVQNNTNLLNAESQAYTGLLNQSGQNYTQLISGANNLLQAEEQFGQNEAQAGRDAFSAASALQTNSGPPAYQNLPPPTPLSAVPDQNPKGFSISPVLLLVGGGVLLLVLLKE